MRRRNLQFILVLFSVAASWQSSVAQVVVAKIAVGTSPDAIAVNPATDRIYVVNNCGNDPNCASSGTVTVIDGATNNTTTVNVGYQPEAIAVNSVTNKIYVTNLCGNDPNCSSPGTVTVIDGASNNTTAVNVGYEPKGVAVNPVTNQIYVANRCGSDSSCDNGTVTAIDGATNNTATVNVGAHPGAIALNEVTNQIYVADGGQTVTVIDGATNNTQTVTVGFSPKSFALNLLTNKIYVVNVCGSDPLCNFPGTVTVIDGVTNTTTTVSVGREPAFAAVNPVTNQIYVTNAGPSSSGNTVTVIDGITLSTKTVNTGTGPSAVAVNSATNKIYVADIGSGDITMIDGATDSVVYLGVGNVPVAEAVNTTTNRIYVANSPDDTVAVVAGASAAALQFIPVTPCRLLDTRGKNGGPIQAGTSQTFNLPQLAQAAGCADLSTASAYSLNPTVVPHGRLGYLTVWPTGEDQPNVSTLNSDGRVKANAAIVAAGYQGSINVFATNTTDLVLDIEGYFAPPGNSTLAFYTLPPCRVADTRESSFPSGLGMPHLAAGVARDFPVLNATMCNIPDTAVAYSLNFTAVPYPSPGHPLGYLEVWPTGNEPANPVSTLNNPTGTVVANAAIVAAGSSGKVTVLASNDTNLVMDVDGYFAAPGGQNALSLYPAAPCRVLDTRSGNGAFVGELTVNVSGSVCSPPSSAQAYVFNATVVPSATLGYLTLWPDGGQQPGVSTLNALDGAVTSNMAIVPSNINPGFIDAFATNLTQLILDISSYFAP